LSVSLSSIFSQESGSTAFSETSQRISSDVLSLTKSSNDSQDFLFLRKSSTQKTNISKTITQTIQTAHHPILFKKLIRAPDSSSIESFSPEDF